MPPGTPRPSADAAPASPPGTRALAPALAIAVALALLAWTCRRAPLGTPVMDDFDFLHAVVFGRRFDLFGAMDANAYWRPVSRQLYYGLLGPVLLRAPAVAALVHLAALTTLGALLLRAARRWLPMPAAIAVATFPLLAEPARVLLTWPSAAQPLLAMVFAALALVAALARRWWGAALAALAAGLSYEQGLLALALPLLVAATGQAGPRRATLRPAALATAGALALLAALELAARAHGTGLLGPAQAVATPGAPWPQLALALRAQLGLLEAVGTAHSAIVAAWSVLALAAFALASRSAARARLTAAAPLALAGLAWFALAAAVAGGAGAALYAWRSMLPALGLGLALAVLAAALDRRLPLALVAVRVAALLLAPVVPPTVEGELPDAAQPESFIRVARLQRVVGSAHRALAPALPTRTAGAVIGYWVLPQQVGVGFDGARAAQVWTRDSTARWEWIDDLAARHDAVLAFEPGTASPAILLAPGALADYAAALAARGRGEVARADSLAAAADAAQRPVAGAFREEVDRLRADCALRQGAVARADSLVAACLALGGRSPVLDALAARLALARGQRQAARAAAERCLARAPDQPDARAVLRALEDLPR